MHTADVVLIGGGIVGSSIAYHLVASGCKNVVVIERESAQGTGSTGKSMGGVRAQFSTPVNIQMSLYSIPFYASFEERLGYPCDYRPQGYLFCATNEKHLAYLRANYEKQIAMGLKNVRLMAGDEIRSLFPQLRGDDIVGGSFCATDRTATCPSGVPSAMIRAESSLPSVTTCTSATPGSGPTIRSIPNHLLRWLSGLH